MPALPACCLAAPFSNRERRWRKARISPLIDTTAAHPSHGSEVEPLAWGMRAAAPSSFLLRLPSPLPDRQAGSRLYPEAQPALQASTGFCASAYCSALATRTARGMAYAIGPPARRLYPAQTGFLSPTGSPPSHMMASSCTRLRLIRL